MNIRFIGSENGLLTFKKLLNGKANVSNGADAKDALITDLKKFLEDKIEISTQEQTDWDGNLDFTISSSNNSFQLVFKGKSTNRVSCPKK